MSEVLNQSMSPSAETKTRYSKPPVWERHTHLYAILDAAQDERIYEMLMACTEEYSCLYNGKIPNVLARAAPYLIKLPLNSSIFEEVYQNGFYNNWGIFFTSYDSGKDLKRHFQQFLKVQTEDGKRLYFRYYDPRVLRVYLPTCTRDELRTIFGSVSKFWVAGEQKQTIMEYGKDKDRFYITPIDLSEETMVKDKKYSEEDRD